MSDDDIKSHEAPLDVRPEHAEAEDAPAPPVSTVEDEKASRSLHRSTTKRIFGGVAGGIAERFDVDANIVRVVFVVLAIVWGLGVVLYLAMWAIIPSSPVSEADADVVADEPSPRRARWLRYALPLGLVIIATIFFTSLGGVHRFGPGDNVVNTGFDKVLVLLWLLFLVALAVISLRSPSRRFSFGRFLAMIVLTFMSFIILSVGAFLVVVQVIGVPLEGGSGVKVWQPTSVAQIQHSYHGAFGESTIDLVHVPFTNGTWSITATQGVGVLIVEVPSNAVVDLRTHVGIGNVQSQTVLLQGYVPASRGRSPHLDLNLQVGVGQLEIRRFVTVAG